MQLEKPLRKYLRYVLFSILSVLATVSISTYVRALMSTETAASSFFTILIFLIYIFAWCNFPFHKQIRFYIYIFIFSIVFSLFIITGQRLDLCMPINKNEVILLSSGLLFALFPVICIITNKLDTYQPHSGKTKIVYRSCLIFVALCWLLGYLASFPGIYAVDAMTWYLEFSTHQVSSQWSPIYAGLFYIFVSTGKLIFGNYECGLAILIALQSLFIIAVIRNILLYVQSHMGNLACLLSSFFFGLVPTHMIISMQTVQGAPFMACFGMIIIHLSRMINEKNTYWMYKKNYLAFILWGVGACVLRNNAYFAFIIFLIFIVFYHKEHRIRLFVTMMIILIIASIYKGPVLNHFGVSSGSALKESLSLPLQQMAYAYSENPSKLTQSQKEELECYVAKSALIDYPVHPEISDTLKANLNTELIRSDFIKFAYLYFKIGLRSPTAYLLAAYTQNLGLLYIDKSYPDPRTWHPYINYASYNLDDPKYIKIKRISLFPQYERLLGELFGYTTNGYGGDVTTTFSSIPILGALCRVSTYFWCYIYLITYAVYKKRKDSLLYLGLVLSFTLTILAGPVIMYRYYAPVVFTFPVIIASFWGIKG